MKVNFLVIFLMVMLVSTYMLLNHESSKTVCLSLFVTKKEGKTEFGINLSDLWVLVLAERIIPSKREKVSFRNKSQQRKWSFWK